MERDIAIENELDIVEIIRQPYEKVQKGDIPGLEGFYQKKSLDALFDPITASKDTIFHVAVQKGSKGAFLALLNLVPHPKRVDLLKLKNIQGNTIVHEVAITGNVDLADALRSKLLSSADEENIGEIRRQILGDRNNLGETPLFRAAEFGQTEMVKYLVKKVEEVGNLHDHYRRNDGVTILHSAVISQNLETAIWLLKKDPQLATYKDNNGKTILHLLAKMPTAFKSTSQMHKLEWFIYYCFPSNSDDGDGEANQAYSSQMHGLESGKLNKSQHLLNSYRDSKMNRAICKWLASEWKPLKRIWESKKTHFLAIKLVKMLVRGDTSWFEAHKAEQATICLEREEQVEARIKTEAGATDTGSSRKKRKTLNTPLLIAASTGIIEIVRLILEVYPQAVEYVNQNGHNILHISTLHRKIKIYELVINEKKEAAKKLVLGIDYHGSTILHHAANTKYYHGGSRSTPALQLQEELTWFKIVEKQIPLAYTMHRNKDNHTAEGLFKMHHQDQLKRAQYWVKNTCQSSSTVAILVATVVFAAAFTAPGGFYENSGEPVLLQRQKPLYSFFTVMDVAGLASSLTAVVIFLSVLTSSLELPEFRRTIPRNMSIGFTFLFFSVATTMLTFTATIFLLVPFKKTWTASLTYAAALLPISVFAFFQFHVYYQYAEFAAISIFDLLKKILPGV